eukprot:759859_1
MALFGSLFFLLFVPNKIHKILAYGKEINSVAGSPDKFGHLNIHVHADENKTITIHLQDVQPQIIQINLNSRSTQYDDKSIDNGAKHQQNESDILNTHNDDIAQQEIIQSQPLDNVPKNVTNDTESTEIEREHVDGNDINDTIQKNEKSDAITSDMNEMVWKNELNKLKQQIEEVRKELQSILDKIDSFAVDSH